MLRIIGTVHFERCHAEEDTALQFSQPLWDFAVCLNIAVGAALCFIGLRSFKLSFATFAFVVGGFLIGMVANSWLADQGAVVTITFGGAVASAALSFVIRRFGVFLLGAYCSGLLSLFVFQAISGHVEPAFLILMAIVGGTLAIAFERPGVILCTSVTGSWFILSGVAYFALGWVAPPFLHRHGLAMNLPDLFETVENSMRSMDLEVVPMPRTVPSNVSELVLVIVSWVTLSASGVLLQWRFLPAIQGNSFRDAAGPQTPAPSGDDVRARESGRRVRVISAYVAGFVLAVTAGWVLSEHLFNRGSIRTRLLERDTAELVESTSHSFKEPTHVALAETTRAESGESGNATQVKEILENRCFVCHGQDGAAEGGLNFILNVRRLVERGIIVPKDASNSKLYGLVKNGLMPKDDEPLSDEEINVIGQWVDAGAPDFNPEPPKRIFISPADVLLTIKSDLQGLAPSSRRFHRYFTVTHLYNAGISDPELETYRHGLSKLLNSLSWSQRIIRPVPIDTNRTILRIDLTELEWTEKTWDRILEQNPYGITYESDTADYCYRVTGTQLPHVRADWFVARASVPPLYHDVLDLPQTDRALEERLGIDVASNLLDGDVARAGFTRSGVSNNNRLIERHECRLTGGAYWKSYDFSGNTGRKNLLAHPLGPYGKSAFEHDGGEIIFNLPNGLQAYMLVNAAGKRIDEGPIDIVSDPKNPERTVVNGLSCMSCHSRGIIEKSDEIRNTIVTNPAFGENEVELVKRLYPPVEDFQRLQESDAHRFATAVEKTGAAYNPSTEPILTLAKRFEEQLDLSLAAAEAGVPEETFVSRLKSSARLSRALAPLLAKGTVKRQVYVANFARIVADVVASSSGPGSVVTFQFTSATEDDAEDLDSAGAVSFTYDEKSGKTRRFLRTGSQLLLSPNSEYSIPFLAGTRIRFESRSSELKAGQRLIGGRVFLIADASDARDLGAAPYLRFSRTERIIEGSSSYFAIDRFEDDRMVEHLAVAADEGSYFRLSFLSNKVLLFTRGKVTLDVGRVGLHVRRDESDVHYSNESYLEQPVITAKAASPLLECRFFNSRGEPIFEQNGEEQGLVWNRENQAVLLTRNQFYIAALPVIVRRIGKGQRESKSKRLEREKLEKYLSDHDVSYKVVETANTNSPLLADPSGRITLKHFDGGQQAITEITEFLKRSESTRQERFDSVLRKVQQHQESRE